MRMNKASKEDLLFGDKYEQAAADVFVAHMWPGAIAEKRYRFAAIDFDVRFNGKLIAFLEVKRRRVNSYTFPTTAVVWDKYIAARNLFEYHELPVIALIVFEDRAGYFNLVDVPDDREYIERADRAGSGRNHALYSLDRLIWLEEELRLEIETAVAQK